MLRSQSSLRKKLHIASSRNGLLCKMAFPEGTRLKPSTNHWICLLKGDRAKQLAFDGSGYLQWEGLVCRQEIGHCTDEHREQIKNGWKTINGSG